MSVGKRNGILCTLGNCDGALELLKRQEEICRQSQDLHGLRNGLGGQAAIFCARGDWHSAMNLYRQLEEISRELGDLDGEQTSLGGQALILTLCGDLDGAMKLHRREAQICRRVGNEDALQRSLRSQSDILYARGDVHGAGKLWKQLQRLSSLSFSVGGGLAAVKELLELKQGKSGEAQSTLEEACRVMNAWALAALMEHIKPVLEEVRNRSGSQS